MLCAGVILSSFAALLFQDNGLETKGSNEAIPNEESGNKNLASMIEKAPATEVHHSAIRSGKDATPPCTESATIEVNKVDIAEEIFQSIPDDVRDFPTNIDNESEQP